MNPVERNIEKISKIVFTKSGFNLFWGAATLSAELDCKSEKENPNDKTSKNSHHLEEKNHNQKPRPKQRQQPKPRASREET